MILTNFSKIKDFTSSVNDKLDLDSTENQTCKTDLNAKNTHFLVDTKNSYKENNAISKKDFNNYIEKLNKFPFIEESIPERVEILSKKIVTLSSTDIWNGVKLTDSKEFSSIDEIFGEIKEPISGWFEYKVYYYLNSAGHTLEDVLKTNCIINYTNGETIEIPINISLNTANFSSTERSEIINLNQISSIQFSTDFTIYKSGYWSSEGSAHIRLSLHAYRCKPLPSIENI